MADESPDTLRPVACPEPAEGPTMGTDPRMPLTPNPGRLAAEVEGRAIIRARKPWQLQSTHHQLEESP